MLKLVPFIFIVIVLVSCRKVNNDCNVSEYPNAPDKDWFASHGGSGEESHGHFILSCEDGGFLQVGETGFVPNSAKILVVKTDQNGVLLWKKEFSGGTGHNLGNSAYETDDGYLICGALNENSALIKLNKTDGGLIFEKAHDNGGSDAFEHLTVTQNEIIAVGYAQAEDNANTFFTEGYGYLTFMDLAGNITNQFNISDEMAQAYRIKALGDGFVISGLTLGASDYKLININIDGNVMWSKTFGGPHPDHCFGMDVSADGSIYLTGHTLSGTENWDTYTMKVDGSGNQIWESKQGNPRGFDPKYIHDEAWGIRATSDGGCVVVAGTGDEFVGI